MGLDGVIHIDTVSDGPSGDSCRSDNYGGQEKLKQWSHSEFSKIPRSCYEKSQDWTKNPKLYWKHEKTVKIRTILHSQKENILLRLHGVMCQSY